MQSNRKITFAMSEGGTLRTAEKSPYGASLATRFLETHGKELFQTVNERLLENKVQIDHTLLVEIDGLKSRIAQREDELSQLRRANSFLAKEAELDKGKYETTIKLLRNEVDELRGQLETETKQLHQKHKVEKKEIFEFHQYDICYLQFMRVALEKEIQELKKREKDSLKELAEYKEYSKGLEGELGKAKTEYDSLTREYAHAAETHHASSRAAASQVENRRKLLENQIASLKNDKQRDQREFNKNIESSKQLARLQLQNAKAHHRQEVTQLSIQFEGELKKREEQLNFLHEKLSKSEQLTAQFQSQLKLKCAEVESLSGGLKGRSNELASLLEECEAMRKLSEMYKERIVALEDNNVKCLEQQRLVTEELQELREVLRESSLEMDYCREEILLSEKEKASLRLLVEESEVERERIILLVKEKEGELNRWRESYYTLKNRF